MGGVLSQYRWFLRQGPWNTDHEITLNVQQKRFGFHIFWIVTFTKTSIYLNNEKHCRINLLQDLKSDLSLTESSKDEDGPTTIFLIVYWYCHCIHDVDVHTYPKIWALKNPKNVALREKCPNTEFIFQIISVFGLNTEILKFPYTVRIQENKDQKKLTLFTQCGLNRTVKWNLVITDFLHVTFDWKSGSENCSNTEIFLVRIFLYSDWIRRITE